MISRFLQLRGSAIRRISRPIIAVFMMFSILSGCCWLVTFVVAMNSLYNISTSELMWAKKHGKLVTADNNSREVQIVVYAPWPGNDLPVTRVEVIRDNNIPIGEVGVPMYLLSIDKYDSHWIGVHGMMMASIPSDGNVRTSLSLVPVRSKEFPMRFWQIDLVYRELEEYFSIGPVVCILFFGTPRGIALIRKLIDQKRLRHQNCARCGYDMRASPHRCPECGTARPIEKTCQYRSPPGD